MLAGQRSLNLSNAVAVAVFEAWRQHGYEGGESGPFTHSACTPAALITRAQCSRSLFIRPASASGVVPAALKYCPSIRVRTSSLLMMRISSRETRSIVACGVLAGASTACHEIASKPG